MLIVLMNWCYIAITVFLLGYGFSALSNKVFGHRVQKIDSLLMAGMIFATVYAQYYSLIGGVGVTANLILVLLCIIIFVLCRKNILDTLSRKIKEYGIGKWVTLTVLIGAWAFFTSRGYMHYDSDLYHAQSIRWIEEYGVVPGLGNLHERFAYNSSFFAVSALYSMRFLAGRSLHTLSVFFAVLLSITVLDITDSWKRKRFVISDYARVGGIYYLTTIVDEVVSPASDYSIMCVIFFIIIKWLDLLDKEEKRITPYALLCVVGVYAITLKLTAGLILILLIKPAYLLIKEKRVKQIVMYLLTGLVVAIPWFARTVVISGWLIYPFSSLNLFQVDWKMNSVILDVDAAQISAWGRALYNVNLLDTPLVQWFPNWFRTTLSGTEKLLILSCVACVFLYAAGVIWVFVQKKRQHLDMVLVLFAVICSYLFWQMSAPLTRYGYAYVLLLVFLCIGWMLTQIGWNKVEKMVYFVVTLYGCYKVLTIGQYICGCYRDPYYIWQKEYGVYELETFEVEGLTFYKPVEGDRTGYEYFPASPTNPNIELRGDDLKDGFRRKE